MSLLLGFLSASPRAPETRRGPVYDTTDEFITSAFLSCVSVKTSPVFASQSTVFNFLIQADGA